MAEWKKVVVSGSDISQLNNNANYLINGQSGASLTGSFSGSFTGTTNLPDLTNGEGIAPFTYDGSSTATVAVSGAAQLSDNAVTKWNDTDGKFANSNITDNGTVVDINSATTISGSLNVTGSQVYINTDDFKIYYNNFPTVEAQNGQVNIFDTIQSQSADFANRQLYDSNAGNSVLWEQRQLIKSDGTTVTVDWENGLFSGSFSGSFQGDGSQLTGVSATSLANSLSQGTGITAFTFNGSTAQTVEVSGSGTLSANTLTKWTGDAFADTSITDNGTLVTVNADTTFNQDVAITGDLTVNGTASFQNTQNLLVADRFVLFASGSVAPGDGGIVVQQGTQNVGELFGYDSSATRWGFTSSFAADSSGFTPAVYVGAVQTGTGQTAASAAPIYGGAASGYGTIHVDTDDGEIWIYA
jgi:hypothetical protein